MNLKYSFPFRSPDVGGSPSGAGGGAAPASGGALNGSAGGAGGGDGGVGRSGDTGLGAGSQPGSAASASAWTAPDFLPEHLRGEDLAKTFEKLAPDWKAMRDRVAALPAPPKSVDEYKFDPSDKVKPFIAGDLSKDPAFTVMRDAALKAGVPAAAFSAAVGAFYEGLADKGLLAKPWNAETERDALIGENARFMTAEQKDAQIRPMLMPIVGMLDGLKNSNAIDADGYARLGSLLDTASGVRALAALVKLATPAGGGLNPGGAAAQGGAINHSDLKARQRDPRNTPGDRMFDPSFRAETDRLYQQAFR